MKTARGYAAGSGGGHGREEERSGAALYGAEAPRGWLDAKEVVSEVRRRAGVSTARSHYHVSSHDGMAHDPRVVAPRVGVAAEAGAGQGSTPTKWMKAGWGDKSLLHVLEGIPAIVER